MNQKCSLKTRLVELTRVGMSTYDDTNQRNQSPMSSIDADVKLVPRNQPTRFDENENLAFEMFQKL